MYIFCTLWYNEFSAEEPWCPRPNTLKRFAMWRTRSSTWCYRYWSPSRFSSYSVPFSWPGRPTKNKIDGHDKVIPATHSHFATGWHSFFFFQKFEWDIRPIKTRFRCAFALCALRQATQDKSLAHSSIGTLFLSSLDYSGPFEVQFLVDKWFQVLFQRPHRPAFHLSLTVLVHYRSRKVFSLTR